MVFLRNALTGEQVIAPHLICLFPGDPAPDPPPPPPSQAEFVEAARAALTTQTSVNPSPEIGGLTGLDTWMWCDDPGEVQVGVALRGWTAEATMDPVGFKWAVGGVEQRARSTSAGVGARGRRQRRGCRRRRVRTTSC